MYEAVPYASSGGLPLLLRWVVSHRNAVLITCTTESLDHLLRGTSSPAGLGRCFGGLEGQTEEGCVRGTVLDPRGAVAHVDSIASRLLALMVRLHVSSCTVHLLVAARGLRQTHCQQWCASFQAPSVPADTADSSIGQSPALPGGLLLAPSIISGH